VATEAERLRLLYDVSRRLASVTGLEELLRFSTERARELFDAESCALLLLDRKRRELHFPIVSESPSHPRLQERLAEIRFPADRGVAGWVLNHDQAALVSDVASDPRFYGGVDQMTSVTTRSLLCAPLRTGNGNIGVIEVINPGQGSRSPADLEFLEGLAGDIAVACEKARLYEQVRGEVLELRQLLRIGGVGLLVIGLVIGAWSALAHLALAQPLGTLIARPGVLAGLALAAVGGALVAVSRGWLVGVTASARGA